MIHANRINPNDISFMLLNQENEDFTNLNNSLDMDFQENMIQEDFSCDDISQIPFQNISNSKEGILFFEQKMPKNISEERYDNIAINTNDQVLDKNDTEPKKHSDSKNQLLGKKRNPKNDITEKKVHAKNKKDLPKNGNNSKSEKTLELKILKRIKFFKRKLRIHKIYQNFCGIKLILQFYSLALFI